MSSGFVLTIILLIVFGFTLPLIVSIGSWVGVKSDDKKAKLHVFHHEAAHAVLSIIVSIGFHSISVIEDKESLGRVKLLTHPKMDTLEASSRCDLDPYEVEALEDHLKVILAGYAVEELVFGKSMPKLRKNFGDMGIVNMLLAKNPWLYKDIPGGKQVYFDLIKSGAKELVKSHLPLINVLAEKLKSIPEMSEEEVITFLKSHDENLAFFNP